MTEQQSIKVIIAEDQQILLESLAELLNNESNIEVVGQATNGQQALSIIKKEQPDLAILDIRMPLLSGIQLTEILKTEYPKIKILILSLHKKDHYINKLMDLGVDGYILKERGKLELIEAINTIIKGDMYIGRGIGQRIVENKYKRPSKPLSPLTKREIQILVAVAKGFSTPQISRQLFIKENTVITHRRNIREKLQIKMKGATGFLRYALKHEYMSVDDLGDIEPDT